jgi:AAA+ superfamily predicted ATPase
VDVPLFFRRKNKSNIELQVDLGDLDNEKELLSSFLQSNLQVSVDSSQNKLTMNSENVSARELRRVVIKFIYHRNLNLTHWVSIKGATVKINRFKDTPKKKEKHKKDSLHQTAMQSWGL